MEQKTPEAPRQSYAEDDLLGQHVYNKPTEEPSEPQRKRHEDLGDSL